MKLKLTRIKYQKLFIIFIIVHYKNTKKTQVQKFRSTVVQFWNSKKILKGLMVCLGTRKKMKQLEETLLNGP